MSVGEAEAPAVGTQPGLRGRAWRRFLSGPDVELLQELYEPALQAALRYDRCCAYFSSSVLAAAARGFGPLIERLESLGEGAPKPAIRLLVNEELDRHDVRALMERGDPTRLAEKLRRRFGRPQDALERSRLSMLAWLASTGLLEVRVGVMRGGAGVLHAKFGIVRDAAGDALVFAGSGNETAQGLRANYEQLEISSSWDDPERYEAYADTFEQLWTDRHPAVHTVPLPEAVRQELIRYAQRTPEFDHLAPSLARQRAAMAWTFVAEAPYLAEHGGAACDATALVDLWPHQRRVVEETSAAWPEGRLLCDEVGLGKTIEAILILRRLLAGRGVRRALILLPAGLLRQWQAELREKGGLVVPRLENLSLIWPDETATRVDSLATALKQELLLVSRELARMPEHRDALLAAEPWDLVVLDEAHHARRSKQVEGEFNAATQLLELLRQLQLRGQARSLLLLSATPMQTHPWEPWDLLAVLGEGGRWLADFGAVRDYYAAVSRLDNAGCDGRAARRVAGLVTSDPAFPPSPNGDGLHQDAAKLAQRLQFAPSNEREQLAGWLRRGSPLSRRMHRNTRDTLRHYWQLGLLPSRPPDRKVEDLTFEFATQAEKDAYDAITDYIDRRFAELEQERGGKGFVMTVYRRRAASSPHALRRSLLRRAEALQAVAEQRAFTRAVPSEDVDSWLLDDLGDDWAGGTVDAALPTTVSAARNELREIERLLQLLDQQGQLDSKRDRFYDVLNRLLDDDRRVLVFTEYTDTLTYLRDSLHPFYGASLGCYSGDGGQLWQEGGWRSVTKDVITSELTAGRIRVLLCTDAASEGLNLQSASAVVNYDLPWNPSKVEQRIGRVDRIGQQRPEVLVVNLFLKDSVDERVYRALQRRCGLFRHFVGPMQPVLARARRMLLGAEPVDLSILDQIADAADRDTLVNEAYLQSDAAQSSSSDGALHRGDLVHALKYLSGDVPVRARPGPRDGLFGVSGAGARGVMFGAAVEALEHDRTAIPLTPFSPTVRKIAETLNRSGDRVPLVAASHESGAFRSTVMYWVTRDTTQPVTSYQQLVALLDGWDGAPPPGPSWLDAQQRAKAEARARVEAMETRARERECGGLARQHEAARLRLMRELSRYLFVMGASRDDPNARWYELLQERDRSAKARLERCFQQLGGWPTWDPDLLDDAAEFVRRLGESQRRTRVAGSEIDAALADPRWLAVIC